MSIEDTSGGGGKKAMSPRLPLKIPSGRVHVYFVSPSVMTNEGKVERTSAYYTEADGTKFKFMARDPAIREDLMALGKRGDLADVDEIFQWASGGGLTVRIVPRV